MGYRCPVCDDPQADGVHLANHLAFTALVRAGDHEDWLDDHVPDWGEMGEGELAEVVGTHAEEADYPSVFEDTTERVEDQGRESGWGHEQDHPETHDRTHGGHTELSRGERDRPEMVEPPFGDDMDEEVRAAVEQARELTRKRRENATGRPVDETAGEEEQ